MFYHIPGIASPSAVWHAFFGLVSYPSGFAQLFQPFETAYYRSCFVFPERLVVQDDFQYIFDFILSR